MLLLFESGFPRHSRKRRIDHELVMKIAAADFSGRFEEGRAGSRSDGLEISKCTGSARGNSNSITERCYNPPQRNFPGDAPMEG
jgi:hypothetical protein